IMAANEYEGPAVVVAYTTCQPEHGVADSDSYLRAKLAVYSRAFPLLIHDPRKGESLRERLSLAGNPAPKEDWYRNPKTGEVIDFIAFARGEARFAKHFDEDGNPSKMLLKVQEDRLRNWRLLQELAGLR
ncbi:MAG: thiamine pyrophosphate-binding protein, partial [Candidatus Hydrothermae bacterium]|nr:thiamine pyrophosphate-binding protein [Candidatus Hydrothermae bacterium]